MITCSSNFRFQNNGGRHDFMRPRYQIHSCDTSSGPLRFHVPKIEGGYYTLQLMDACNELCWIMEAIFVIVVSYFWLWPT
jgi:hypothetical protein